jgi:hypothetical protein
MARLRALLAAALVLLILPGCHRSAPARRRSIPPLLIADRGVVMSLDQAMTKVAYQPYVPAGTEVLAYAVIPPLGDKDAPATRGIAIEYERARRTWLLSQWPKQNFILLFLHGNNITDSPCTVAHYKVDGVAWTTRGSLAMTLQPDGTIPAAAVDAEARRLIAAGACTDSAAPNPHSAPRKPSL